MGLATVRARSKAPSARRIPRPVIIAAVLVVAAAALYVFGVSSLNVYRLNREAARLETLRRGLEEHNAILREEMKLLQTPRYIEKLAREQLGLVKPGEVAILIIQPPPRPQPTPARLEKDSRSLWQRLRQVVARWLR